jgi:predicted nucleic acid-binding protein
VKKVLCDINVILDILLSREPFHRPAGVIFGAIERGVVRGYLCAVGFPTLHYLLAKHIGTTAAVQSLNKIRTVFRVAPVDEKVVDLALASSIRDFEDAVQYYSATSVGADILITRNKKDYPARGIPVVTPEEFLAGE